MFRVRAITFAMTLFAWPVVALAATPPALVSVLGSFVKAVSGTDSAAFTALFAPDPSITDTVRPYHWQGKDAAAAYFTDLQAALAAVAWTNFHVQGNGDPFVVSGQDVAYASIPLLIDYSAKGIAHQDPGIFTLSLKQSGTAWRILSATWTYTKPPF